MGSCKEGSKEMVMSSGGARMREREEEKFGISAGEEHMVEGKSAITVRGRIKVNHLPRS